MDFWIDSAKCGALKLSAKSGAKVAESSISFCKKSEKR